MPCGAHGDAKEDTHDTDEETFSASGEHPWESSPSLGGDEE